MKRFLTIMLILCTSLTMMAQGSYDQYKSQKMSQVEEGSGIWGRDTTQSSRLTPPYGVFQWTLDPHLGDVVQSENTDTITLNFQNWRLTDGMTGNFSHLGNTGAPRLNRIFMDRKNWGDFDLWQHFDYVIGDVSDFRFSNTKSPLTNIAYHSAGNKENGEDRFRANFATNINKVAGIGFKIDYDYGRGYYNNDQISTITGNVYGYYRGEKYSVHGYIQSDRVKEGVGGGIVDDRYIEDPMSFGQKYTSDDIPSNLNGHFYSNYTQQYFLSQRYNIGFDQEVEQPDSLKPQMPTDSAFLAGFSDSVRTAILADTLRLSMTLDSMRNDWEQNRERVYEFIPVVSIFHVADIQNKKHNYYSSKSPGTFYTHSYYGSDDGHNDNNNLMSVRNTLGVTMREGFKKWAKFNLSVFGSHEMFLKRQLSNLPDSGVPYRREVMNKFSVGGELTKQKGKLIHYGAKAEFVVAGYCMGDFTVTGHGDLNIPLSKDTLRFRAKATIENLESSTWMESYHSKYASWDNELNKEFRTGVMGEMEYSRTRTKVRVGWQNLTNFSYYAMRNTLLDPTKKGSTIPGDYSHDVVVRQAGSSIQVIMAQLCQDVKVGPVHWDNELTYQFTSNKDILPLPAFNAYSNLYLLFKVAKVLNVQLGADVRFFTKYYAPDFATAIGQFAVQDVNNPRVEIGNYPIINAYANLFLKRCRLYVNATHVNAGTGRMYLAPHYPINPMSICFGLSWNFLN